MRLVVLVAGLLVGVVYPICGQNHLMIVGGLGGDQGHRDLFHGWAVALVEAAQQRMGIERENIVYLSERPERDSLIDGESTKENIRSNLIGWSERVAQDAQVLIILIGHGSYQGDESRFSLPGPDMTAEDFADLLGRFDTQRVVFVNTASASGDFVRVLSASGRTVITATKSAFERNETVFCEYFVRALAEDVADVDKDQRVSVLEAFEYARTEVAREYESESKLLTEHAVLDDNGDGVGSAQLYPDGDDGSLAARTYLGSGSRPDVVAADDPVLRDLYVRRDSLEARLAELRLQKEELESAVYEERLEDILLTLAETSFAIRERGRGIQP